MIDTIDMAASFDTTLVVTGEWKMTITSTDYPDPSKIKVNELYKNGHKKVDDHTAAVELRMLIYVINHKQFFLNTILVLSMLSLSLNGCWFCF